MVGGPEGKNPRGEKRMQNCYRETVKYYDLPKNVGVDWRIIIKWILKK
jgi:hypothetical protein